MNKKKGKGKRNNTGEVQSVAMELNEVASWRDCEWVSEQVATNELVTSEHGTSERKWTKV